MSERNFFRGASHAIALVGDYVPRQCGIATFSADILRAVAGEAPDVSCWAVVMNDVPEGYPYPPDVRFELNYKNLSDYRLAADFLNVNQVDVVCLQHEFGIYGGPNGAHILELLRNLRMPVVATLHTVLQEPSPGQKATLEEIARYSERLVVMSHKAVGILKSVYNIPPEKIVMIHHGIPDLPFVDPNFYKDQFGVEGRKVILTFGLLSPGKGIEYMIDALPAIVKKHEETAYIILGATHPHVKREQGEAYRHSLQRRAKELGVEDHVIFYNRYVDLTELCEFLGCADIYATPYLAKEQITSGTLAYALGAGKATVSTGYWYAQEMLADGRGRVVPFRDSDALAQQALDLLDNEVERHAMRKRAYTFSREMVWKEVARRYLEVFSQVKDERAHRAGSVFHIKTLQSAPLDIPEPDFTHVRRLTDDVGILQHAKFIVPNRFHGYCTDDNARALVAVLMAQDLVADNQELLDLACCYLSFLDHAFNEENGSFRNFMGYDRKWLEEVGSEDSHGRAIWGLGTAVGVANSRDMSPAALGIFERALPVMMDFDSPRAWAFGVVGVHAYLHQFGGDSKVRRFREWAANRLFDLFKATARKDWPWIEETVTYDNGKIPQALLMSGQWMQRGDMIDMGLQCLDWLIRIQTDPKGHFVPIGNQGWYTRNGEKARFDQQPIEAQSLIEACREAYNITRKEKWIAEAHRCLEWFLGRNDHSLPLYDYKSGGCHDGLTVDGVNRNQGAEATLALILSLLDVHSMDQLQAATAKSEATGPSR